IVAKYSGDTTRSSATMRRSASLRASTSAKLDSYSVATPGRTHPGGPAPRPGDASPVGVAAGLDERKARLVLRRHARQHPPGGGRRLDARQRAERVDRAIDAREQDRG